MMTEFALPSLSEWPRHRAAVDPRATAIDDGSVVLTYAEFLARTDAQAHALATAGYRRGDRIATLTRNGADHLVLLFACAARGIALVPLSWRLTDGELRAQLAVAEPAALLASVEFLARAATLAPVAGTLTDPPPVTGTTPDDASGLLIVFTSGTAATPKAAVLTEENCRATNESLQGALHFTSDDVVLGVLPQYHAAGWNTQPLLALATGATLLLEPRFDPTLALHLIAQYGVTSIMGVPSTWRALARDPQFATTDFSRLRNAVVGGAPAPRPLLEVWRARGVHLRQGYGLTEAGPNVLCQTPDDARTSAGASGRPYPLVHTALDDRGELLVRGAGVFAGYFRDPVATAEALQDGWLHTGDLAEVDPDGQYRIVDRAKDIFISGGENVAPAEIEVALGGHPAVIEVAVVGVPHEVWGEVGVAYVVAEGVTSDELRAYAAERLAAFKVPDRIEFVTELPHSGLDKIVRRRLPL